VQARERPPSLPLQTPSHCTPTRTGQATRTRVQKSVAKAQNIPRHITYHTSHITRDWRHGPRCLYQSSCYRLQRGQRRQFQTMTKKENITTRHSHLFPLFPLFLPIRLTPPTCRTATVCPLHQLTAPRVASATSPQTSTSTVGLTSSQSPSSHSSAASSRIRIIAGTRLLYPG
jgi:hypothetical protein